MTFVCEDGDVARRSRLVVQYPENDVGVFRGLASSNPLQERLIGTELARSDLVLADPML